MTVGMGGKGGGISRVTERGEDRVDATDEDLELGFVRIGLCIDRASRCMDLDLSPIWSKERTERRRFGGGMGSSRPGGWTGDLGRPTKAFCWEDVLTLGRRWGEGRGAGIKSGEG